MRALFSIVSLFAFASVANAQETSCRATLAAYQALKNDMSYTKAVEIIGCEGSEISSNEIMGIVTVMYMWSGDGGLGANMNAMFQDNKLMSKAQFGLK